MVLFPFFKNCSSLSVFQLQWNHSSQPLSKGLFQIAGEEFICHSNFSFWMNYGVFTLVMVFLDQLFILLRIFHCAWEFASLQFVLFGPGIHLSPSSIPWGSIRYRAYCYRLSGSCTIVRAKSALLAMNQTHWCWLWMNRISRHSQVVEGDWFGGCRFLILHLQ